MTIHVTSSEGYKIKLWVPTSLFASSWVFKYIKKYIKSDIKLSLDSLPNIYKSLKTYIRKHGHFTLVDLISADGDKVIIKL